MTESNISRARDSFVNLVRKNSQLGSKAVSANCTTEDIVRNSHFVTVILEVEIATESLDDAKKQAELVLEGCRKGCLNEGIRYIHDESFITSIVAE